jgi:hypothetical protein
MIRSDAKQTETGIIQNPSLFVFFYVCDFSNPWAEGAHQPCKAMEVPAKLHHGGVLIINISPFF